MNALVRHHTPRALKNMPALSDCYLPEKMDSRRTFENGLVVACSRGGTLLGGDTWKAAHVLQRYLAANRGLLAGKRVVELGSGAGYLAMSVHLLGSRLSVLTDRGDVLALAKANVAENDELLQSADGHLESVWCDWQEVKDSGELPRSLQTHSAALGDDRVLVPVPGAPSSGLPFDVVLACDCLFQDRHASALLAVIRLLCKCQATVVLLCQSYRGAMDVEAAFFDAAARAGFSCALISQDEASPDREALKKLRIDIWCLKLPAGAVEQHPT